VTDKPPLTIVPLKPVEPNAYLIGEIEGLLDEAREGKLAAIAVAKVYHDGGTGWGWTHNAPFALLLGAMARCMHKLNLKQDKPA
jgi:hypothetical protein